MLYWQILKARPGISRDSFRVQDDGDGPYIAAWSDPRPQPTAEELGAVADEVATETAQAERCDRRRFRYQTEADPLFFKQQRGEVPAGTWEEKIAEIKVDIP